jgi:hypothetical protein
MHHVIIAPHPDDEVIGCYEVLRREEEIIIIYSADSDPKRRKEAMRLKGYVEGIKVQMFQNNIPMSMVNSDHKFYFPDPIYETHPKHRAMGMTGESYARSGIDVTFYTTNMNAPYIHEVNDTMGKEYVLDEVYSSQRDLWKYEKKYILFEGYCKWLF